MLKALIVVMLLLSGVAAAKLISAYRTGEITITAPGRAVRRYTVHRHTLKDTGVPTGEFEGALAYQWAVVLLPLGAAAFFWWLERRSTRQDPFAPDYAGNRAFDEPDGDGKA